MRNRKILLVTLMVAMMAMTGCGSKKEVSEPGKPSVTTESEAKESETKESETKESETKEPETKESETKEPETKESESKEVGEGGGMGSLSQFFGVETDADAVELFKESEESTGFLASDADTVDEMMEYLGVDVEELSKDMMTEEAQVLFHFVMYNEKAAELVNTGDSSSYMSQLIYNDEDYIVLFASDEVDADEVEVFCQEGTTIEYWAIGMEKDGACVLVPIIAGNEENGYYIVRPALISTGTDMSDTMSLVEQGIDFTTDSDPVTEDDDNNTVAGLTGDESITIEITDIEDEGESLTVNYDISSTYPMDVYISEETIYLNGEDITDSVIAFIEVEGNDSLEDCLFIEGHKLLEGDELIISGMLTDMDTAEDIGEIEFVFNLEAR